MINLSYKTINSYGEETYIVKKSRFIGYAKQVTTAQQALDFISEIKQKHKDARHNVSAYFLRDGNKRYSDDGEPQGTAGIPTLEVIEKQEICDVCVVVTRYFGGILLGTGGLVRAYSHTAALAIEAAGIVTMNQSKQFRMQFDYTLYGKMSYILPEFTHKLIDTSFDQLVNMDIVIKSDEADEFINKITELSAGSVIPEMVCEKYFAFG